MVGLGVDHRWSNLSQRHRLKGCSRTRGDVENLSRAVVADMYSKGIFVGGGDVNVEHNR